MERSPPFTSVEIDHIRPFVAQQVDEDLVLDLGEGYFDRGPRQVARVVVYWSLTQDTGTFYHWYSINIV